jgi:AcrR family transcriptional regulator
MNPPKPPAALPRTKSRAATPKPKRGYESPLRKQRANETRERIVAAGAELVRGFAAWDWRGLTFRAVGERAGISERTVHRHFSNERKLHDAVVECLLKESGVMLDNMRLSDFDAATRRQFGYLSSFAVTPETVIDPSFAAIDQHRRDAVCAAVQQAAPDWSEEERNITASILDIFWHVATYERLLTAWQQPPELALRTVSWGIKLIEEAVRQGRRPGKP